MAKRYRLVGCLLLFAVQTISIPLLPLPLHNTLSVLLLVANQKKTSLAVLIPISLFLRVDFFCLNSPLTDVRWKSASQLTTYLGSRFHVSLRLWEKWPPTCVLCEARFYLRKNQQWFGQRIFDTQNHTSKMDQKFFKGLSFFSSFIILRKEVRSICAFQSDANWGRFFLFFFSQTMRTRSNFAISYHNWDDLGHFLLRPSPPCV